jgi:hypothetical protein
MFEDASLISAKTLKVFNPKKLSLIKEDVFFAVSPILETKKIQVTDMNGKWATVVVTETNDCASQGMPRLINK